MSIRVYADGCREQVTDHLSAMGYHDREIDGGRCPVHQGGQDAPEADAVERLIDGYGGAVRGQADRDSLRYLIGRVRGAA